MADEPPTRTVLDAAAGRVLTLLIAVNSSLEIRVALMSTGYTPEEHSHAWSLLGQLGQLPNNGGPKLDQAVQAAVTELNAWDEPHFSIIHSILAHRYAAQEAFLFENLAPSTIGSEAVLGVATLLGRLDALEHGKGRDKKTHAVDKQALDRLAARGYPKAERDRLAALVKTAKTVVEVEPVSNDESDAIKAELAAFWNEWSTQAKVVIKRRDLLLRLGVGKRKKAVKAGPTPPVTPPAVPPITPTPAAPPPPPAPVVTPTPIAGVAPPATASTEGGPST